METKFNTKNGQNIQLVKRFYTLLEKECDICKQLSRQFISDAETASLENSLRLTAIEIYSIRNVLEKEAVFNSKFLNKLANNSSIDEALYITEQHINYLVA